MPLLDTSSCQNHWVGPGLTTGKGQKIISLKSSQGKSESKVTVDPPNHKSLMNKETLAKA